MRKERQVGVLERLLGVTASAKPEPNMRESTVEVERYTSPETFEAERKILFRTLPIVVGRAEEVPSPGSFFTHDAAGVPILVTHDQDGKIHAMLNVCRHRGTRLVDATRGTAKAFVCPYHAWTYDLRGNLGHLPLAHSFQTLVRDESSLVELPCEVRHGFIWVVPRASRNPHDPFVAAHLGPFDDDFADFGLERHVVFARSESVRRCNWKLVMEAFLEGYHVKSLHQRTLARFFAEEVVVDYHEGHARTIGARKNISEIRQQPPETWDVRACATVFYNLFPNGVLVLHPELMSHIALFPNAIDEVVFIHTMLAPHEPESDEQRAAWQKTWELIDGKVFATEDLAICESIQSVLHAEAQRTFQLGSLEHSIRFFHDTIDRKLGR